MEITVNIHTYTGGVLQVTCNTSHSIHHLKRQLARRLRITKDRICLLYRDRQLSEGTLKENGLVDGSKVILLPCVETGLLTQRPENSVMQALESLNDSQVNDFLSGKTPLNLTMRLGDHMMLIQLQLSTLKAVKTPSTSGTSFKRTPGTLGKSSKTASSSSNSERPTASASKSDTSKKSSQNEDKSKCASSDMFPKNEPESDIEIPASSSSEHDKCSESSADDLKSFLRKQDIETLQNAFEIFKSLAEMQEDIDKNADGPSNTNQSDSSDNSPSKYSFSSDSSLLDNSMSTSEMLFDEQSPIKSLSNLVSSPLKSYEQPPGKSSDSANTSSNTKYVPLPSSLKNNLIECLIGAKDDTDTEKPNETSTAQTISDPIAANLTSCLCSSLDPNYYHEGCMNHASDSHISSENVDMNESGILPDIEDETMVLDENVPSTSKSFDSPKPKESQKLNKNKRLHNLLHKTSKSGSPFQQAEKRSIIHQVSKYLMKNDKIDNSPDKNAPSTSMTVESEPSCSTATPGASTFRLPSTSTSTSYPNSIDLSSVSDTKALFEASKNLTQTLKKLSKEVLTNKVDLTNEETTRSKIGQGAVIESMKHHGKGIYSGTFSGTLNPALQDRFGRPKRDISTIIHILNDLLCATPPQYRSGARMTFEPTHNQSTRLRQRDLNESSETCEADHTDTTDCTCNKCTTQTKCPYGECNGHYPSPNLDSNNCPCKSSDISNDSAVEVCLCDSSRMSNQSENHECIDCPTVSDKKNECKKCCSAKDTLALENSKTKCKLDQLRLVMQQKKQRREARKMKTAPYVNPVTNSNISSSEAPNVIAEEIDTVA